jgi:hypothetical protein
MTDADSPVKMAPGAKFIPEFLLKGVAILGFNTPPRRRVVFAGILERGERPAE